MIFAKHIHKSAGEEASGRFPQYVVALTLSGEGMHNLDGEPIHMRAGDVHFTQANVLQHWGVASQWENIFAIFDPRSHWSAWLRYPWRDGYYVMRMGDAPAWPRMVERMQDAAREHREDLQLNAVEEVLIRAHEHYRGRAGLQDERVAAATAHIAAYLGEPLDVDAIADAANLSRSRLAALFGAQLGCGVMQYVERQRMERARQLLRYTSEPIASVARDVGYEDPKYFSKRFGAACGVTPTMWREGTGR